MHTAYVTSKGQLVVPSGLRRRYGIKPGTRINFIEENGRIIFQPVTRDFIRSFRGRFKLAIGEKPPTADLAAERDASPKRQEN
jgi:AbrB family looped-hinge helix DNA binding protein